MSRLGLPVPRTFLLPAKDNYNIPREVIERFTKDFDLQEIFKKMEGPCYIKPHDGGGWRNVTLCEDFESLQQTYSNSNRLVMNIQKAIPFEKYIRCLCIGNYILPIKYNPDKPYHERYETDEKFLNENEEKKIIDYCKIINAFHGLEINSVEFLIKDGVPWLIDFNNPVPDLSVVSLHKFFRWAVCKTVQTVIKYSLWQKPFPFNLNTEKYLQISANNLLSMEEKEKNYLELSNIFFAEDAIKELEKETFNENYFKLEDEFFNSEEYLEIVKKELGKSFSDENDPGKFDRFFNEYKGKMGLSQENSNCKG
ncbi:RimK family alpha-L-glutamate ligase [Candidatus Riflebacteria bacterium]